MNTKKTNDNLYENSSLMRLIVLGIIIGTASVVPGLSGGVIAVSLGLYTAAIDAIVNIKRNFAKSIKFLLPLGIGAAVGIFVFGIIIEPLIKNYESYVIYLFIGLIIGSIPSFLKEANESGFRLSFIIPTLAAFCFGTIISSNMYDYFKTAYLTVPILLLSGSILAFGMIIPGISSSFILIQMNVYEKLIYEFTHFNLPAIFWTGLGFITALLLSIKLVSVALKKYRGYTYFAAFGFLLSSVVSIFPPILSLTDLFIDLFLVFAGSFLSYFLVKRL